MKYFTRELLQGGRSKDHAALNRQEELWDEACDRYFRYLDTLKAAMPPGLRQLVDGYYLHDAVVRGMEQQGRNFLFVLQLDTPPQSLLTLNYDPVEDAAIDRTALPPEPRRAATSLTGSTTSRREGAASQCSFPTPIKGRRHPGPAFSLKPPEPETRPLSGDAFSARR